MPSPPHPESSPVEHGPGEQLVYFEQLVSAALSEAKVAEQSAEAAAERADAARSAAQLAAQLAETHAERAVSEQVPDGASKEPDLDA